MAEFRIGLGNPIEMQNGEPMRTYGVLNPDNTVRYSYLMPLDAVSVASGLNSLQGMNPADGVQTTLGMFNSGNPFKP